MVMTFETWWLYVTVVFVISGTPGPNMLHVMTRGAQLGFRRTIPAMLGCLTAILIYVFLSALGLGALLKAYPQLFNALRIAGAAYLIWIGIKAWRGSGTSSNEANETVGSIPAGQLYRGGLWISLSNPKLIIFAAALFPQFIDPARSFGQQMTILVTSFLAIECAWYAVYACGGRSLSQWLRGHSRQRLFGRITGSIFMGFGCLLLARRA
jgi:threonine/homoserine/homoserine lactone efflux protein